MVTLFRPPLYLVLGANREMVFILHSLHQYHHHRITFLKGEPPEELAGNSEGAQALGGEAESEALHRTGCVCISCLAKVSSPSAD